MLKEIINERDVPKKTPKRNERKQPIRICRRLIIVVSSFLVSFENSLKINEGRERVLLFIYIPFCIPQKNPELTRGIPFIIKMVGAEGLEPPTSWV